MTVQNYMATQTLPALAAFVAPYQANVGGGVIYFSTPKLLPCLSGDLLYPWKSVVRSASHLAGDVRDRAWVERSESISRAAISAAAITVSVSAREENRDAYRLRTLPCEQSGLLQIKHGWTVFTARSKASRLYVGFCAALDDSTASRIACR